MSNCLTDYGIPERVQVFHRLLLNHLIPRIVQQFLRTSQTALTLFYPYAFLKVLQWAFQSFLSHYPGLHPI